MLKYGMQHPHRDLHIILRTCDRVYQDRAPDADGSDKRYCQTPKAELIRGCASSLVWSINAARGIMPMRLTILDDHSSESTVSDLRSILDRCEVPCELIRSEASGSQASLRYLASILAEQADDLFYSIEDDYLHTEGSITEMLETYLRFEAESGGRSVVLFPFDDAVRYQVIYPTMVLRGTRRHWKLIRNGTHTLFGTVWALKNNWDLLMKSIDEHGITYEDEHINIIWRDRNALLFSPLPSVALHLTYQGQEDPFVDWQAWWAAVPRLWESGGSNDTA